MALAGGETAQMPGLYQPGTFDLAGTIVGVVEEDRALHGDAIVPGDVLLGYASTGLHTNGYTLARRIVFERMGLEARTIRWATPARRVAEALLAVHRSYYRSVSPVLDRVHGLAHITGGGIAGNLVRILPQDCEATVDPAYLGAAAALQYLQQAGQISTRGNAGRLQPRRGARRRPAPGRRGGRAGGRRARRGRHLGDGRDPARQPAVRFARP